jgi:RNA polymerase sigma-70 factor (ECF subfamily)
MSLPKISRESSDLEVIDSWRNGDKQALAILYDRYGELVYRMALRILGNQSSAEDLTQEIFTNFFRHDRYDVRRGNLSSFLMLLTRSRAIDYIRRQKSQQQMMQKMSRLENQLSASPMDKVSLMEIADRVRSALQELPEKQRQVLELAYYGGMSQSEIAHNLAIPLGTVKSWSRNGLLKLRSLLADLGE